MSPVAAAARARLDAGRAEILARHRAGAGGQEVVRSISALTDDVVQQMFAAICAELGGAVPSSATVQARAGALPSEVGAGARVDAAVRVDADGSVADSGPLALIATGGYGRRELSPRSDVDLLALLPPEDAPAAARARADAVAERFHRALWDADLEAGFAARTLPQTLALAREDHTARMALLDCRLIVGDSKLYKELERAMVT